MKATWMTGMVFLTALLVANSGCSEKEPETTTGKHERLSTLLIEPNLAVGPVRAGMTLTQVVAELGEPQRRTSNALEYIRFGLAIMPGPDERVQVVMCGDVTGINGPFAKAFSGRTREGIGMNSTREEVIRAFGEPTASEKMRGGLESLQYGRLGITFTLEGGKVHHMIVRLREPQEPDRTVTLEPASETSGK